MADTDDAMGTRWYWCRKHDRVESEQEACRALDRLGPYDSPEAARNWRSRAEQRNEAWEEEDEAWDAWPSDEQTSDEQASDGEPSDDGSG